MKRKIYLFLALLTGFTIFGSGNVNAQTYSCQGHQYGCEYATNSRRYAAINSLEILTCLQISGKFNQKFETSLNKLTNLKTLLIGGTTYHQLFNQPLENSLDNLVNLETLQIFNGVYNQPFGNSLDKLIKLNSLTVAKKIDKEPFFTNLINRGINIY